MKVRVMSDLHVEHGGVQLADDVDCDVVVLAGDIDVLRRSSVPAWARALFPAREIVWVLGNHEHYNWRKDAGMEACIAYASAEADHHGVHFLENRAVELNGVRFLGCTLWTDFELLGDAETSMRIAAHRMADFRLVRVAREPYGDRSFTPADSAAIHKASVAWLDRELARPFDGKTVVVTHHNPHQRCDHPAHASSPMSPAFCSDLGWLIERHAPDVWISGHTHVSYRFHLGRTLLISNQRGYSNVPEWADAPFNPNLVIEV
jgi:predicted phosphodiesterase